MKTTPRLGRQFDCEKLILVSLVLLACVLVLATAVQPWIDPRWLYMDTQTVGELSGDCCHIYDGAMSTLGIKLWAATAAISVLTSLVCLRRRKFRAAWFAAHAALVSGVLALDDAFLLHEVAFPKLGISQTFAIAMIGILILSYLGVQHAFVRASYRWLLALSLAAFAVSVGIDQVFHSIASIWIVAEDGPKFIGIITWFLFHLMVYANLIVPKEQV